MIPSADGSDPPNFEENVTDDLISKGGAMDINDESLGILEPEGIVGVDFFLANDGESELIAGLYLQFFNQRAGIGKPGRKKNEKKQPD
ncbi:hypothetical protein ACFL2P_02255 [Candidatus Moduliflexota bacterium]